METSVSLPYFLVPSTEIKITTNSTNNEIFSHIYVEFFLHHTEGENGTFNKKNKQNKLSWHKKNKKNKL